MLLTVFRSRLKTDLTHDQLKELMQMDSRMGKLARTIPGFISNKTFGAEDGERVVVIEFESEQAQMAFVRHPDHLEAMKMGPKVFQEYSVQVCNLIRKMGSLQ